MFEREVRLGKSEKELLKVLTGDLLPSRYVDAAAALPREIFTEKQAARALQLAEVTLKRVKEAILKRQ